GLRGAGPRPSGADRGRTRADEAAVMGAMMAATGEAFVSYSLNCEDVLIHRAFRDVARGFYVDVGAWHPRDDSDTRALYERGWSGLCIEPLSEFAPLYAAERPRDVFLPVALSDHEGEIVLHEIPSTGLSSVDASVVDAHRASGLTPVERRVPARTLASVLAEHGVDAIDLLKVDAEGAEEAILDGNDWTRFRPRLVVVEATLPQTPQRRETGIAAAMAARGYRHVHFDGLNDFYAERDFALPDDFVLPPNVFDGFVPARVDALEAQTRSVQDYAKSLRSSLDAQQHELENVREAQSRQTGSSQRQIEDLQTAYVTSRDYAHSLEAERDRALQQIAALTEENARLARERTGFVARLEVIQSECSRLATAEATARS
ncbi:FkbM family methyltransferase, partial [Endobacter medicaginis]